eukprot:366301-Chlamydomonas_euryale.AAC.50
MLTRGWRTGQASESGRGSAVGARQPLQQTRCPQRGGIRRPPGRQCCRRADVVAWARWREATQVHACVCCMDFVQLGPNPFAGNTRHLTTGRSSPTPNLQ